MLATTGVTHADAVTDLLRALTGLKGWFREIQHGVYDGHSAAELLLLALLDRQGPVRVTALADAARVDPSVVSRQLAALEAAGLVARTPDPSDGRAHRVAVAPAGAEVLHRGRERLVRLMSDRLTTWSAADLAEHAATTARLLTDLTEPRHPKQDRS